MHTGWEQEAVRRTRQGQSEAYAELVDRFDSPIHNAVFRIVGDHDRADDITQQAFVAAYEHLACFDPRHRFFSWVYRIALNRALNAQRRRRGYHPLEELDVPTAAPTPEEAVLATERAVEVRAVLDGIPAKYRVLLTLRYYLGMPYEKIALALDLPVTTVKSRLHTARALAREGWLGRERADRRGRARRPAAAYIGAKP